MTTSGKQAEEKQCEEGTAAERRLNPGHSLTKRHPRAKERDFEVLATNYSDRRKRKLTEAMFIRDLKPTLNKQKESYKLALFA